MQWKAFTVCFANLQRPKLFIQRMTRSANQLTIGARNIKEMGYTNPRLGYNHRTVNDILRRPATGENGFLRCGRCPRNPGIHRFGFLRWQKSGLQIMDSRPAKLHMPLGSLCKHCPTLHVNKSSMIMCKLLLNNSGMNII